MSTTEAKAEIFWMAFKGLPRSERERVVKRLLDDKEFMHDLMDIAVIRQRHRERSRPLKNSLADKNQTLLEGDQQCQ